MVKIHRLYEMVTTGLECGSYSSFYVNGDEYGKAWRAAEDEAARHCFAKVCIEDRYAIQEKEEPAGPPCLLTDAALRKGFKVLLEKYKHHAADIIGEKDDAITGDAFLQCVAFGDIVYG